MTTTATTPERSDVHCDSRSVPMSGRGSHREKWRRYHHGTDAPLGRLVTFDSVRIGLDITRDWDAQFASDVQARAKAFQSLVNGGLSLEVVAPRPVHCRRRRTDMRKFIIAAALVATFLAMPLAPALAEDAPSRCKYQRSGVSFVPQTHWLDDRTETVLKAAANVACGRECVGIAGNCQSACAGPKYGALVCELAVVTPLVRQQYIDTWTNLFRPDLRTDRQKAASSRYQEEQRQLERRMREVDKLNAEHE